MNFLAHDVVLPPGAPAVLRVAAAVPDLWSLLPKRPLPVIVRQAALASDDPEVRAVGEGITAHLRADAVFHRHPEFVRRVTWLERELRRIWPRLGSPELGAHILVEMLLDRWLMQRNPTLVDRYYASFQMAHIAFVSVHAATDQESQKVLATILESFASSRFLADYAGAALLIDRFTRRLERVRFAAAREPPIDQLVPCVEVWSLALADGSTELLRAVEEALEHPAGRAQSAAAP